MTEAGTNGIVAVNSVLNLNDLEVVMTSQTDPEDIKAMVGFLSIFEGSQVFLRSSNF